MRESKKGAKQKAGGLLLVLYRVLLFQKGEKEATGVFSVKKGSLHEFPEGNARFDQEGGGEKRVTD